MNELNKKIKKVVAMMEDIAGMICDDENLTEYFAECYGYDPDSDNGTLVVYDYIRNFIY